MAPPSPEGDKVPERKLDQAWSGSWKNASKNRAISVALIPTRVSRPKP
jgi:hypothetical protein